MEESRQRSVQSRLNRLAWLLDNSIRIPVLNVRIGLDGFIGLIPGLGDMFGVLLASTVIVESARLGAPKSVLMKMGFNLAVDALVGMVPIIGDLFDFAWKANHRNVSLLNAYLETPQHTTASSRRFLWVLVLGLLGIGLLVTIIGFVLLRALINLLLGG